MNVGSDTAVVFVLGSRGQAALIPEATLEEWKRFVEGKLLGSPEWRKVFPWWGEVENWINARAALVKDDLAHSRALLGWDVKLRQFAIRNGFDCDVRTGLPGSPGWIEMTLKDPFRIPQSLDLLGLEDDFEGGGRGSFKD